MTREQEVERLKVLLVEAPIRYFYNDVPQEPTALEYLASWLTDRGVRLSAGPGLPREPSREEREG